MDKKKILVRSLQVIAVLLVAIWAINKFVADPRAARAACSESTMDWLREVEKESSNLQISEKALYYDFYYTTCLRERGYDPGIMTYPAR